jgi:hypothetical protein
MPCSFSKMPACVQRVSKCSGAADRPNAPRAILRAEHARGIDLHRAAGVADLALPATELVEARRLHVGVRARVWIADRALVAFGEVRGARDPEQARGDPGLVVVEGDAQALHRLEDLEREGADLDLAALEAGAA